MTRVRRSDPADPGISRQRRGRGFSYKDRRGRPVRSAAVLERIRELAIPPAWRDVWICPDDRGHIQAVGTDDAGRRQYLYHADWRAQRDRDKFRRLPQFGRSLPGARKQLARDLATGGLGRQRVLACAVRLLDIGLFRVGGEDYAEDNNSYGLATLQRRHVKVRSGVIRFDYVAKGGIRRTQEVADPLVTPTVLALKRRSAGPQARLLAYRGDPTDWRTVSSADINERLKELVGAEFSAKYFRTWNATVLAAMKLAERPDDPDPDAAIRDAVEEVAFVLGNTPAVCRDSYIAPRVIRQYRAGRTIRPALTRIAAERGPFADRAAIERAVIRLLG